MRDDMATAEDNILFITHLRGDYGLIQERIYAVDISSILQEARERVDDHVGFRVSLNAHSSQLYDVEFSMSVAAPQFTAPEQLAMAEVRKSKESSAVGPSES